MRPAGGADFDPRLDVFAPGAGLRAWNDPDRQCRKCAERLLGLQREEDRP